MTGRFNIHGLDLEISADHPVLFKTFAEDLSWFRCRGNRRGREGAVRLTLERLPDTPDGNGYPRPFAPYREIGLHQFERAGTQISRYARSAITVFSSDQPPRIRAGIVPDSSVLADPAYHYCFTQPIGFWLKQRGLFFLHAGCVSEGPHGVLIIGPSRSGKSILSLSAVRAGFRFLSDEQPLLAPSAGGPIRILPFPRRIRLDRSAARRLPELKPLLRGSAVRRLIFPIERIWPGCVAPETRPRLLIFPRFRPTGRMRLGPLKPARALGRLMQDDHFVWYLSPPRRTWVSQQHLALFERLILEAPSFELEYGNGDLLQVPGLLRRLLRG